MATTTHSTYVEDTRASIEMLKTVLHPDESCAKHEEFVFIMRRRAEANEHHAYVERSLIPPREDLAEQYEAAAALLREAAAA